MLARPIVVLDRRFALPHHAPRSTTGLFDHSLLTMKLHTHAALVLALLGSSWLLHGSEAEADTKAVRTAAKTNLPESIESAGSPSRWMLTEKPVPGMLSSNFGIRPDPVHNRRKKTRQRRRRHQGVDFVATRGTLVHAAGPGIVVRASFSGGYGRVVIIDHGHGLQTRYAHLQRFKTKKGEFLPAGAVLGSVGSSGRTTGPHLHFEVRQDGVALPPADVIQFKLPSCSRRARHCRSGPTPNS